MLAALGIREAVIIVVVDHVMVMHHDGLGTEQVQYIVFIKTCLIFLCMSFVESDALIAIESHAAAIGIHEYDCVIPVQKLRVQTVPAYIRSEILQLL